MMVQYFYEEQQVNNITQKEKIARKKMSRRERHKRSLLLVVVTILGINAAVTSLLISWQMPTVVSFDMKKTVDQFTEQAGAQSLDETQSAALTERFMTNLNDELQDWQHSHDAVILVKPAVVCGAADITNEIQTGVAHRMAEHGGW